MVGGVSVFIALAPAVGQTAPSMLRAPTCTSCKIEATRLFALDNSVDSALLEDWPISMAMDTHGRIALAVAGGAGLPMLYDSLGRAPRRIGRVGSGPNEYRAPIKVSFRAGDTLHVIDLDLHRRTELVGNARPVKSSPYSGQSALLEMLPGNEVLVVRERFSLYSQSGSLRREWGEPIPPAVPGGQRRPTRRVSNVVANKYWAVNSETCELEQWTLDGKQLARIRRSADWLDTKRQFSDGTRGDEPTPYIPDLHIDAGGRLWILINVPRKDWQAGLGPAQKRRGITFYPNADFGVMYETLVEVIDVTSPKLTQSARVPAYLRFILSDSRLAALRHGEDGSPAVDIWRVAMKTIP